MSVRELYREVDARLAAAGQRYREAFWKHERAEAADEIDFLTAVRTALRRGFKSLRSPNPDASQNGEEG